MMFRIDVGRKLLAVFVIIFSIFPNQVFANFTINTDTTYASSIVLDVINPALSIVVGGNLAFSNSGNSSAIFGQNRTDFQLTVSANNGQGISSSGASAPAITIYQGLLAANINSGRVTSDSSYGTIEFWDSAAGTNSVNISSNTSVNNTKSTAGNSIWYHNLLSNDATLNITNAGTIAVENDSTSSAIRFDDANGGSTLNLTNSGTISAGALGRAVYLTGSNVGAITNSGTIIGSLIGGNSAFNVTNSSGSISGNISLGDNAASTLDISGGAVTGNVTFGNADQMMVISGGSFSGGLMGDGVVDLGAAASFALNSLNTTISTSDFTAQISGSSNGDGLLVINAAQDVTAGGNIGELHFLAEVLLSDNSVLRLNQGVDQSLSAGQIILSEGSKIYVGSATVHGDIISYDSSNHGSVYLTADNNLDGNIGVEGLEVSRVEISPSVVIAAGGKNIEALNIVLGEDSKLNISAIVSGSTFLDAEAVINFRDGSSAGRSSAHGTIDGSSNGVGTVNTRPGSETIYSALGSNHKLADFSVKSDSQATLYSNVAATKIEIDGQLILANEAGNNLVGDVVVSSSGEINLNAFSHAISGTLALNSGASLATDISTITNAGNITVSGAVSIEANAILKLSVSGSMKLGSHYTLVAGGSGSSLNKISDANITIDNVATNHVGIFSFSTVVEGNNLIVEIDRYQIPELRNSHHSRFYNVIARNYEASGSLLNLQQYLDSTSNSNGQKSAALDSANSQIDNSSNRLVFDNVNKAIDLVSNRISALNGGGLSSGDDYLKRSAWIEIIGSNSHQGNAAGLDGYGANSNGIIIGLGKKLDNDVILGVAGLYSNSAIKSTSGLKRTDITSYQINLYASKEFENFFLNSVVGMGFNRYSSHRSIAVAGVNASAKYLGNNYVARVEVGKNFKVENNFIITPILRLTAANNSINSYDENGAGTLNLSVRNDSTNFLEGRVGAALSKSYYLGCDNIAVPSFSLSYGYDFIGDPQKSTANFIGQSATFGSSAARIAQGSTKVGVGVKFYNYGDASLAIGYELDQRSKYHAHNGFMRVKYAF